MILPQVLETTQISWATSLACGLVLEIAGVMKRFLKGTLLMVNVLFFSRKVLRYREVYPFLKGYRGLVEKFTTTMQSPTHLGLTSTPRPGLGGGGVTGATVEIS